MTLRRERNPVVSSKVKPGRNAGVREGDIVGGVTINDIGHEDLHSYCQRGSIGHKSSLTIIRGTQKLRRGSP